MTASTLKGNTGAHHYEGKPKPETEKLKVVRNCLRCGTTFVAPTLFIRLCGCTGAK